MPLNLDYFYGNEAEQYSFYRIPKTLFTDDRYKSVSVEAKVLYGLLLDRMGLSMRNGWFDDDGKVYIFFTLEDAMALMGCGKDKVVKLFRELDKDGGIGLIERKKQGQGRPAKIYVKNFTLPLEPGQTSEKPKSALLDSAEVLTSEKPKSALLETGSLDFGKSAANKTDKKNTEKSDTESIYPPSPPEGKRRAGAQRRKDNCIGIPPYFGKLAFVNIAIAAGRSARCGQFFFSPLLRLVRAVLPIWARKSRRGFLRLGGGEQKKTLADFSSTSVRCVFNFNGYKTKK